MNRLKLSKLSEFPSSSGSEFQTVYKLVSVFRDVKHINDKKQFTGM